MATYDIGFIIYKLTMEYFLFARCAHTTTRAWVGKIKQLLNVVLYYSEIMRIHSPHHPKAEATTTNYIKTLVVLICYTTHSTCHMIS